VRSATDVEQLGQTRDDAAGECFDKVGKLLGLGYPGGPRIDKLATLGKAGSVELPRPLRRAGNLVFSFSGLKTAVALAVKDRVQAGRLDDNARADIAAGVQQAIVETLVAKTMRALEQTGYEALVVAGGVGANRLLRATLAAAVSRQGARVFYPRIEFCTDNAAMIAVAGMARLKAGLHEGPAIHARAKWALSELAPLAGPANS
jgi:N6-L-threonylcarbamoyladenine synthase